jgi:hypothetical protein
MSETKSVRQEITGYAGENELEKLAKLTAQFIREQMVEDEPRHLADVEVRAVVTFEVQSSRED